MGGALPSANTQRPVPRLSVRHCLGGIQGEIDDHLQDLCLVRLPADVWAKDRGAGWAATPIFVVKTRVVADGQDWHPSYSIGRTEVFWTIRTLS